MAARHPRLLLTGFEAFGPYRTNPTQSLVGRLDGEWAGDARIVGRVLPVSIGKIEAAIDAVLDEVQPIGILALGLSGGESCIRLERTAHNALKFPFPDNDGKNPTGKILRGGPATRAGTLPYPAILKRLLAAGIPARLSDDPGRYLCNAVLYHFAGRAQRRPCGFVHVPASPEMVAEALRRGTIEGAPKAASMGLRLQLAAIRIALAELARKALK